MKTILLILSFIAGINVFAQSKIHITTAANIAGNSSFINDAGCNNNSQALVFVEVPSWWVYNVQLGMYAENTNVYQVYYSNIGVWYDAARKQWAVFNQNKKPITAGINFRITICQPSDSAFVYIASANKLYEGKLIVNHPLLNGNASAKILLTQNWSGSASGVYNSEVKAEYNTALQKWIISNINGQDIPVEAAFNILIKPAPTSIAGTIKKSGTITTFNNQHHPFLNHKFRLVCEGFEVLKQTSDDVLERDGPGDEAFFTFDVAEYKNGFSYTDVNQLENFLNAASQKYALKTAIHGTSQLGWPNSLPSGFVKAGTAKDIGGLRSYDRFLPMESNTGNMTDRSLFFDKSNPRSFPLIIWEGTLTETLQLIVLPCTWEWDRSIETKEINSPVQNNWSSVINSTLLAISKCRKNDDYEQTSNFWLPEGKQSIAPKFDFLNSDGKYLDPPVDDKFAWWLDKSGTQPFREDYYISRIQIPNPYPNTGGLYSKYWPAIHPLVINQFSIDNEGNPVIGNGINHARVEKNRFVIIFTNQGNGEGSYKLFFRLDRLN